MSKTPEEIAADLLSLRNRRAEYVKAEVSILNGGQSYTIGSRSLNKGDLKFIASMISILGTEIEKADSGVGIKCQGVVMLDV